MTAPDHTDAAARAGIPTDSGDVANVGAAEERVAAARRSSIEAGRRRGGIAGAALAGSMLALRDIYEGPPRDDLPIEIEAAGDPHDVDRDGIALNIDGVDVSAPPLPPTR
ncbi:MAG: hypothetical protein WD225_06445 [Ilumatobacteraceae bacterium]